MRHKTTALLISSVLLISQEGQPFQLLDMPGMAQSLLSVVGSSTGSSPATLQDFWNGQARFEFQNRFVTPTENNPDNPQRAWIGWNVESDVIVVGNTWYLFTREARNTFPGEPLVCPVSSVFPVGTGPTQFALRTSTDKGMTWSPQTVVISNLPGQCQIGDGAGYYDGATNKWHFLYQCQYVDPSSPFGSTWQNCYASYTGSNPAQTYIPGNTDPTKAFVADPSPAIINGTLWSQIANAPGAFDEGTVEIVEKSGSDFYVTFHGQGSLNNQQVLYRAFAHTPDFHHWAVGTMGNSRAIADIGAPNFNQPIFGKSACDTFTNPPWPQGTCAGGGEGTILYDHGYYYHLIENNDQNHPTGVNIRWGFALMRSHTLANANWEAMPGNRSFVLFDSDEFNNGTNGEDSVGYTRLFRDTDGSIYLLAFRQGNQPAVEQDPKTGYFLYKLVTGAPRASYNFREGPGHTYTLTDEVTADGDLQATVQGVSTWTPSGTNKFYLRFDGQTSKLTMPDSPAFNPTGDVSLEVSLAAKTLPPADTSAWIAGKVGSYWFELYPDGSLCFWINNQNGSYNACEQIPAQDWPATGPLRTYRGVYHAGLVALYEDGNQKQASTAPASALAAGQPPFSVGQLNSSGYWGPFNGAIDSVKVYDYAVLTASSHPASQNGVVVSTNPAAGPPSTPKPVIVLSGLSTVHVYPNPVRTNRGDQTLTFDQMPSGSTVKIFTLSARHVKTLSAPHGSVSWDLTNDSGDKVASGLYLYLITDGQGNKTQGKLSVIR